MRSDLDRLMTERKLDALIIPGTEGHNPQRDYLTGGVKASAIVVKKRGQDPLLIVDQMERDEARKSPYPVLTYDEFDLMGINKQHGRGTDEALAALWLRIFERMQVTGRVTFYGAADMQYALRLLKVLENSTNGHLEIVRDAAPDMLRVAYQTKDADEIAKLSESGARTSAVMQAVRAWLGTHRIQGDEIVDAEGKPLTIGAVKRYVRWQLMEHEMEDAEGTMIFAQGYDAGVPHSRGNDAEVLRPGESLIFDLFPRPIGGGYFHDVTRTWCLGYARPEVEASYKLVMEVFGRSLEGITLGESVRGLGRQVCEWFEAAGHPTRLSTPTTTEGYTHSLGHGIGLFVHEDPVVSHQVPESMVFQAGNMLTIEPGLYYPSKGYGVRIEDTVYLDEGGQLHKLTDCPYDLVIELSS